jgi:hypothetical protein
MPSSYADSSIDFIGPSESFLKTTSAKQFTCSRRGSFREADVIDFLPDGSEYLERRFRQLAKSGGLS